MSSAQPKERLQREHLGFWVVVAKVASTLRSSCYGGRAATMSPSSKGRPTVGVRATITVPNAPLDAARLVAARQVPPPYLNAIVTKSTWFSPWTAWLGFLPLLCEAFASYAVPKLIKRLITWPRTGYVANPIWLW